MSLADRLIQGLRAHEAERSYRLERVEVASVGDAMAWLRAYEDEAGTPIWRERGGRP